MSELLPDELKLRVAAVTALRAVEDLYPDTGKAIRDYLTFIVSERMRLWEESRPHPAPAGVRVPEGSVWIDRACLEAIAAGNQTSADVLAYEGYDDMIELVPRLNPQPGAEPLLSGDQADVSNAGGVVGDVDALAQEIRRVDGNHNLGAGALAEALMPFLCTLANTDKGSAR